MRDGHRTLDVDFDPSLADATDHRTVGCYLELRRVTNAFRKSHGRHWDKWRRVVGLGE
jgi:hypothetical protein